MEKNSQQTEQKKSVLLLWLKRIGLSIATLFVLSFLLLKLPPIQNALASQLTNTLSNNLQVPVDVHRVEFSLPGAIIIDDFYLEDLAGDTLLFAEQTRLDIESGFLGLLRKEIVIRKIKFSGLNFNLNIPSGAEENNLKSLLAYRDLQKEVKDTLEEKTAKPLELDLKEVEFDALTFTNSNVPNGNNTRIFLEKGLVHVNQFDFEGQFLDFRDLLIDGLDVEVELYDWEDKNKVVSAVITHSDDDMPLVFFDEEEGDIVLELPDSTEFSGYLVKVGQVKGSNNTFSLDNLRSFIQPVRKEGSIDYSRMRVKDIAFEFNDLLFADDKLVAEESQMSFQEESGFKCEQLVSKTLELTNERLSLNDMQLKTDRSVLGDTLNLNFKSLQAFSNFPFEVSLDLKINEGDVAVEDVMRVAPGLRNNRFFVQNANEKLTLNGQIKGVVDDLRGREISIDLGRDLRLEGDFSFQKLLDRKDRFMTLNLDRCRTSIYALKNLMPFIELPENFNKLGRLNFHGGFSGFFNNFNAFGELSTELGLANMDMNLNVREGKDLASYKGFLNLEDFDLGYWTGVEDLGKVYFSSNLEDGKGLTANTASATLNASIDSLEFKGYKYKDLAYKGQLDKNTISGGFEAKDDNFDLYFNGRIDLQPQEPVFDFILEVKKLNLMALNITDTKQSLTGIFDIDLKNFDLDKSRGIVEIQNFRYLSDGYEDFTFNLASVTLDSLPNGGQELHLDSEILSANYKGSKPISAFPSIMNTYLWEHYPKFMPLLSKQDSLAQRDSIFGDFVLDVDVYDSRGLMKHLHPDLGELQQVRLDFVYEGDEHFVDWSLDMPTFSFAKQHLTDVYFEGEGIRDTTMFFLNVAEGHFGKQYQREPMELAFFLKRDLLEVDISTDKVFDFENKLEINADLFTADNGDLKVHVKEEFLDLPDGYWNVDPLNELQFGKDYVYAHNFVLSRDEYKVDFFNYDDKGLGVALEGLDLSLIDTFWNYTQLDFNGPLSARFTIDEIMSFKGLHLTMESDAFGVNQDNYGRFDLEVKTESLEEPLAIDLKMADGYQKLISGVGSYKIPLKKKATSKQNLSKAYEPNMVLMDMTVDDLPLTMLEYWIGAGVSNTVGNIDASFNLEGPVDKMIIDGEAFVTDAATTIDYINVRYNFDDQVVALKEDIWEVIDGVIYDEFGNAATVEGGIRHNYLRELSLDALVYTDKLLVLDTEAETDELYYGYAMAEGRASFTGTFLRPEFYIKGTSLAGTAINIPVSYDQKASEVDFVEFINNTVDTINNSIDDEPLGIAINMEMNLTEDANVKIIFDEQAGDILEGRGNGNLQMVVSRAGDFEMYGDYVVASGSYLFTLFDFLVNKQFQVASGGTIKWTGDPFAAELDLVANYGNLKAPVGGLIAEYLVLGDNSDVRQEAKYLHDVELSLLLTGIMTNPDVNFNLEFPNLTGELKNYVDTKMRILSQDQNQINLQVFGLIALGQFIPDQTSVVSDYAPVNFGINTVTEVLSQQFSIYLTQLVQQWLEEDGLVSGVDFDVAYKHLNERESVTSQEAQVWDQFQFRINNSLFEDRLSVNLGGNISMNEVGTTETLYLAGDYAVEYDLNNNDLVIRFYQSTTPSLINGRVRQTGLGVSYKQDFNDFNEFIEQLKKNTKSLSKKRKRELVKNPNLTSLEETPSN